MINLIYYYPLTQGAPSNVARDIFEALLLKREQLPFAVRPSLTGEGKAYSMMALELEEEILDNLDNTIQSLSDYLFEQDETSR